MMIDKVRATGGSVELHHGEHDTDEADRLGTALGCPGGFLRFIIRRTKPDEYDFLKG